MNTRVQIITILFLLIGLTACSDSGTKTIPTGREETTRPTKESSSLDSKAGDSIKEADIEKKARYHADLTVQNKIYRLYFFAEDETSEIAEYSSTGINPGDMVYVGTYQVALGLRGEEEYYVQEHLDSWDGRTISWNDSNPLAETIGEDLLVVYETQTKSVRSAVLFSVEDGKVVELTPENSEEGAFYLTGSIKSINETSYQSAFYNNLGPIGWSFFTFERKKGKLEQLDEVHYNEETGLFAMDNGEYWQELWFEDDDFFIPYRDLTPNASWLKEAEKGQLPGVSYPLYTPIEIVRQNQPRFIEEGYEDGGPYLAYPMERFFYSEVNENTVVLEIPGNRLGMTLDEFKKKVGTPDTEAADEVNMEGWYAIYQTGKNQLMVKADSPTGPIQRIRLYADKLR